MKCAFGGFFAGNNSIVFSLRVVVCRMRFVGLRKYSGIMGRLLELEVNIYQQVNRDRSYI